MNKNQYSTKSTTVSVRIPNDLLDEIDELAEIEGVDRPTWIKRALLTFAEQMNSEWEDEAISDYINLRIDEKKLLENVSFKKIPEDINKAREEVLNLIISKRKNEVNKI